MSDAPEDGTNSGFPDARPPLQRLHGPERSAVRRRDRGRWLLIPRARLRGPALPLGLLLELSRADIGRRDSSTAHRAAAPASAPALPVPGLSPGRALAVAALLAGGGVTGWTLGPGVGRPAFAGALATFGDLGLALGVFLVVLVGLRWVEAAILSSRIEGSGGLLRLHRGLPRLEAVAWRLGVPGAAAAAALLVPVGLFIAAAGWQRLAPAPLAGAAAAALVYLIPALYPLHAGPGTRLLEVATGIRDLPLSMRWSLIQRFLPLPARTRAEGSSGVAVAALALAAWAAGSGGALYLLSDPPATGAAFPGVIWQVSAVGALLVYALWLLVRTGALLFDASRLSGLRSLEPLVPDEAVLRRWREDNPLLRRIPELESADWRWGLAPQGTLLTREGSDEREFYWLARGRVHVVARTEEGDPVPTATLGGGAGIGEVSLLERRPRTADVVAADDCVVAILEPSAFRRAAGEDAEERFREVVEASQALAGSGAFWGLGPDERNRWLAHGRPERYRDGETVVEAGEAGRWIGLVVRGRLSVERRGALVAGLEAGDVFGEIAYFSDGRRTATLRARENTTIWRWEASWLRDAISRAGLSDTLRTLARERADEAG